MVLQEGKILDDGIVEQLLPFDDEDHAAEWGEVEAWQQRVSQLHCRGTYSPRMMPVRLNESRFVMILQ